jgi:hypothetical protein
MLFRILEIRFWIVFGFLLTSLNAISAPPPNFSVEALKCYTGILKNQSIFSMNRQYKSDADIEKMVIGICTYSDLNGAAKCYHQAEADLKVLPASKNFLTIFQLETSYAKLCSNSYEKGSNPQTGDLDAIDCFKQVRRDERLLKALKEYSSSLQIEEHLTRLCTSSNGRGATQCILESYQYPNDILKEASQYTTAAGLDSLIIDLCKGTRK